MPRRTRAPNAFFPAPRPIVWGGTCGEIVGADKRRAQRVLVLIAFALSLAASIPVSAKPMQVYGVWHCGSDLCGWDTVPDMTDFDTKNHWLVDRGDGKPWVNLVVLSFVDPLRLLNLTNDTHTSRAFIACSVL
jgi:hypothetical protein